MRRKKMEAVRTNKSDRRTAGVCIDDLKDLFKWRFRTQVADPL